MRAADLKKITKHTAKIAYNEGRSVYVLPKNMKPEDTLFGINAIRLYKNKYPLADFDQIIDVLHKQIVGSTSRGVLKYYIEKRR
jgi:hypothetical protein